MSIHESVTTWRLATIRNNVPIKVIERKGSFGEQGAKVTETFLIPADRLTDFADAMFPAPRILGGRLVYLQNGFPNGLPTCLARGMSWEAWTGGKPIDPFASDVNAAWDTYDRFLRVIVDYETRPENDAAPDSDDPKTYLEVSCRSEGEFETGPPGPNARFLHPISGDVLPLKNPEFRPAGVLGMTFWTVRWKNVPNDFFEDTIRDRIGGARGKVNSHPMPLLHGAEKDSVLFTGFNYEQVYSWRTQLAGQPYLDLELQFIEKETERTSTTGDVFRAGWQHLYDQGTNMYAIFEPVPGQPLYQRTNLNDLFSSSTA